MRSGCDRLFLGTDSAPHAKDNKECACGSAGVYCAHAALELYAEAFERAGALDRLEAFCGHHGADHYGLERNAAQITLEKKPWDVPKTYEFGGSTVTPLRGGEQIQWSIVEDEKK